jgi:hypothetical protein
VKPSVFVPVCNEAATLAQAAKSVLGVVYSYHTDLSL